VTEDPTWTTEFYEDDAGRRPVETWMASLTDAEFMALRAGIVRFLKFMASDWRRRPGSRRWETACMSSACGMTLPPSKDSPDTSRAGAVEGSRDEAF
jgi:hypothetical protein